MGGGWGVRLEWGWGGWVVEKGLVSLEWGGGTLV